MGQQVEFALKESMHRVLVKLASFLPRTDRAAGRGAGVDGARRAAGIHATPHSYSDPFRPAVRSRFRSRRRRLGPAHSPTLLVARMVFWACVVLGFLIGISAFDASYAGNSQIEAILIPYLTHSVGAILILLAGTLIARFLSRSVLIGAVNLQLQYARFLSLGVKWLVLVLTAAMVLDHLEIGGVVVELAFGILFGGIVLTLALAVGLGSRDLVSRSLEKSSDQPPDRFSTEMARGPEAFEPVPSQSRSAETLRHF